MPEWVPSPAAVLRDLIIQIPPDEPIGSVAYPNVPGSDDPHLTINIVTRTATQHEGRVVDVLTHETLDKNYQRVAPTEILVNSDQGFSLVAGPEQAAQVARGAVTADSLPEDDRAIDRWTAILRQGVEGFAEGFRPTNATAINHCAEFLRALNSVIIPGEFTIRLRVPAPTPDDDLASFPVHISSWNAPGGRATAVRYRWDTDSGQLTERQLFPALVEGSPVIMLQAVDLFLDPDQEDPDTRLGIVSLRPRPIGQNEIDMLGQVFSQINRDTEVSIELPPDDPADQAVAEDLALGQLLAVYADSAEERDLLHHALDPIEPAAKRRALQGLLLSAKMYLAKAQGPDAELGQQPATPQPSTFRLETIISPPDPATEQVEPPAGTVVDQPTLDIYGQSGPARLTITRYTPALEPMQICVDWPAEPNSERTGASLIVRTDGNEIYELFIPPLSQEEFGAGKLENGEPVPAFPVHITAPYFDIVRQLSSDAAQELVARDMGPAQLPTVEALSAFVLRSSPA
jgi:hypothetical protein